MAPDSNVKQPLLSPGDVEAGMPKQSGSPSKGTKTNPPISPISPGLVSDAFALRIRRALPDWLANVNLSHVKLGYHYLITHGLTLLLLPIFVYVGFQLSQVRMENVRALWEQLFGHPTAPGSELNLLALLVCAVLLTFACTAYLFLKKHPVYLVDFACFRPEDGQRAYKVPFSAFIDHSTQSGLFDANSLEFQRKILERSGLGEETYLPVGVCHVPADPSMANARIEAEDVMFGCLDELFSKTKVKPADIGVLVVNCSLFCPTPSLSAMIIHRYKLKNNIKSYNLGGMGCSAGVIAVDLAAEMLQQHRSTYAVVVSTENITQNWYFGRKKSMLIPNCLFRMGGAAVLLSNKNTEWLRAKYELVHAVRTHLGAEEKSYRCVVQEEDMDKRVGVTLSRDLMAVAGNALKTNITTLGPLVLPVSEQLLFAANLVGRKVLGMKIKPYIPDFKLAFEHFCVHAGGRAVLDEVQKNLDLTEWHLEPSRMTLWRFGNTSSSSIWYELAYTEAMDRVKRGDRVWQIAFGSGFKCNSAVWRAMRTIKFDKNVRSAWSDSVDRMPIDLSYLDEKL